MDFTPHGCASTYMQRPTRMTNILYDALFSPHAGQDMPFLIRDDGIVLSFDDVIKRAAQLAHVLTGVGVSSGDRIVV